MMVTSSRHSQMGPLTSSASSPVGSHLVHLPADLSPRSSNSSLVSSNESLLNTSLSMPSPGARENEAGSPRVGQGDVSPLQCLQNAFERRSSPFNLFHETENEHLEQQIKTFGGMMGSPGLMNNSSSDLKDSEDYMNENERSPTGSPTITSNDNDNSLNNAANTIFQCPLCAMICSSRHDFNEHLVTHSQQHACPKCSFITSIEEEFRDHVQEAHGVDDFMEILSDDEVKTPKTNAQGKLKTFKCKHCEYRAVTKKEFWDHTKSHIREDKMLHCPKCPFITEYKHHLEYHLRNHMGSKPYQCTKCSYSCVNKSMLNSHLKSHSNIYQYRCSDCSYATKYCHSLKLHLRKYNHAPAMVLNPDGTPNPLPIIDVYGTRRGPKIKRPDPILEGLATTAPALPGSPNNNNNGTTPKPTKSQKKAAATPAKREKGEKQSQRHFAIARDVSPKLASSPRCISSMPNQALTPPLKKMKDDNSSGDSDSDMRFQSFNHHHLQNAGRITHLPQAPISPSSIAMILQQNNHGLGGEKQQGNNNLPLCSPPSSLQLYSSLVNQYLMSPVLNGTSSFNDLTKQLANEQQAKLLAQLLQSNALYAQLQQQQQQGSNNGLRSNEFGNNGMGSSHLALDLRNPKMESGMKIYGGNNAAEEGKRRKRKGKALRYERRFSSDDDDDDECNEDEALDFSNNNNNNNNHIIDYKENKKQKFKLLRRNEIPTDLSFSPSNNNNMQCKYCEISFPDRELYTIHMNFHSGDIDPFLCKSCGKKTRDKIEFFRHLTTDPH